MEVPKKPVEQLRVPLNCLVAPVTKKAIEGLRKETEESQGEVVDRAVALLAFGEEIQKPVRLVAGRSVETEELVERGIVSSEFLPTGQPEAKGTITVEKKNGRTSAMVNVMPRSWKGPLLKPGEKKR